MASANPGSEHDITSLEDSETGEAQIVQLDDETGEMQQEDPILVLSDQAELTLTTNAETGEPEVTWHGGNGEKKKPFQVPRFLLDNNAPPPEDMCCENPQDIVKASFDFTPYTRYSEQSKIQRAARCYVHPAVFFAVLILLSPKIGIPVLLAYEVWFHSKLHSKGGDLIQHRNDLFQQTPGFPYPPLQYFVRMWCTQCTNEGSEKVLKIVKRWDSRRRAKIASRNVCSVSSQVVT